jgi:hypothetical protein
MILIYVLLLSGRASQKLYRSFTEASQKLYRSFTEASQKLHRSFTEIRCVRKKTSSVLGANDHLYIEDQACYREDSLFCAYRAY